MTIATNRADPPEHIEPGLLVTKDAVWAFARLPTFTPELLSEAELLEQAGDVAALLNRLQEGEYHLLRVPFPYSPDAWAMARREADGAASSEWASYLEGVQAVLRGHQPRQCQVYLGKRVRDRRKRPLWTLYLEGERGLGFATPIPEVELQAGRSARDDFIRTLASANPGCRDATSAELRWLVWRCQWRGLPTPTWAPPLEEQPGGSDDGIALIDGEVRNGWRHLRIGTDDAEAWLATLCFRHLPPQLNLGWLVPDLPFPHEVSVRFRLQATLQARREVERSAAAAKDMARHMEEAQVRPSQELLETIGASDEIMLDLKQAQGSLATIEPRIVIWARSRPELEQRVELALSQHRGSSIHLVCPAGDQLALFFEAVPGDRSRINYFRHMLPPITLGGGLLQASSDLGDGSGPYLGMALGYAEGGADQVRERTPVFADPWLAPKVNRPPAILITGDTGSGKTTAALKLAAESRLRGSTVAFVDPKHDADGLAELGGLGTVQRLTLDAQHAGLLDPYRTQLDRGQAAMLAADLLLRFLPPTFVGTGGEVPALVQSAAHQVAQEDRPSMRRVIERIRGYREHPSAELVADNLESVAAMPLARLCFGEGGREVRLLDAITLVQFTGLRLPEPGMDPSQYSLRDRLALGLMTAVMGLLAPLIELGEPSHPKLLVIDEAWMLMASEVARGLIDRYVRLGRSKNTVLMLVTQNARDVLHQEVINNVGQQLHFRRQDDGDIETACRLLGIAHTRQTRAYLKQARSGECLYRDLHGRTGRLQVDLVFEGLRRAFDTRPDAQAERRRRNAEEVA